MGWENQKVRKTMQFFKYLKKMPGDIEYFQHLGLSDTKDGAFSLFLIIETLESSLKL